MIMSHPSLYISRRPQIWAATPSARWRNIPENLGAVMRLDPSISQMRALLLLDQSPPVINLELVNSIDGRAFLTTVTLSFAIVNYDNPQALAALLRQIVDQRFVEWQRLQHISPSP